MNVKSIKENEKGFLVKGIVVMSNLNPGGQIVEEDSCSILADIKLASDSEYPVLPDNLIIKTPPNVETSYLSGFSKIINYSYSLSNWR